MRDLTRRKQQLPRHWKQDKDIEMRDLTRRQWQLPRHWKQDEVTEKSVSKRRQWYHQEQDQSCFPCKRQREESRSEEKHVPVRLPATNAHPSEECSHNEE